jgi:hypothetical protein
MDPVLNPFFPGVGLDGDAFRKRRPNALVRKGTVTSRCASHMLEAVRTHWIPDPDFSYPSSVRFVARMLATVAPVVGRYVLSAGITWQA